MTISPALDFAATRPILLHHPPTPIAAAWSRSQRTLHELTRRLSAGGLHPAITTVYICGSLGRMEQLSRSDADVVVVVDDAVAHDSADAVAARDSVWRELVQTGLPCPKASGVFSSVDTSARLRDRTTRGVINEDMGVFGRRFQMLLDSQPVYEPRTFCDLQSAVLDRYTGDYAQHSHARWTHLLNDLIRYWRSLSVRAQWIESPGEWRLLNAKLRHSRLLNYAGLLLLLGEWSQRSDEVAWLKQRVRWTPLERVAAVFAAHDDPGIRDITSAYGQFLEAMNDDSTLAALGDHTAKTLESPEYLRLKSNSDGMLRSLLGFVLRRTGDWPGQFYESLVF